MVENTLLLFQIEKERKKEKKESRETDENGWTFQKFKSDDLIDVSRNFCIVIRIKKKKKNGVKIQLQK